MRSFIREDTNNLALVRNALGCVTFRSISVRGTLVLRLLCGRSFKAKASIEVNAESIARELRGLLCCLHLPYYTRTFELSILYFSLSAIVTNVFE